MTGGMIKIEIESIDKNGRKQRSQHLVPSEVSDEIDRLRRLAQAWEEDARLYASRVGKLIELLGSEKNEKEETR